MKTKLQMCLVLLAILWSASGVAAAAPAAESQKSTSTKKIMHRFLGELVALKKYLLFEDAFTDPKNSKEISSHLREFAALAKQAKHDPQLQQENFKFSRYVLEEHIADAERAFRLGNKSYVRWQLQSTVSLCMSCHLQMPTATRAFEEFQSLKMYSSNFDQAEFLFATRDFDKAFSLYNRILNEYPDNKVKIDQIETALERELAYFSRIKRDPKEALRYLKLYQGNKKLPEHLQRNIAAWISQLELWSKGPDLDLATATEAQVLEFAKKNIDGKWTKAMSQANNPNLVRDLRVSGLLFEYLQGHPSSKITPEILYWLAICERSISTGFIYPLADLYLRECMIRYSSSPIAKTCFKEYEEQTVAGYTGSSGINVPPEVLRELNRLRKIVDSGGKVELQGH